jgi:hypothetical protein
VVSKIHLSTSLCWFWVLPFILFAMFFNLIIYTSPKTWPHHGFMNRIYSCLLLGQQVYKD